MFGVFFAFIFPLFTFTYSFYFFIEGRDYL
jgi:hypothetical protein